jgi:hypothetical protein
VVSDVTTSTQAPPALAITVEGVEPVDYAAVPTLQFRTRIRAATATAIRSVALHAQIRIAATERSYDAQSQDGLVELFGAPEQWGRNLHSLLWTHAAVHVPEFDEEVIVDIPVGCSYDFDVVATKYFHALDDGDIPLDFLFSGTVFYSAAGRLQAVRIPWDTESHLRMPVRVWHDLMGRYFPHSAWLRLDRDTFDRLYGFKARNTYPTWEGAIEALLRAAEQGVGERG